ncbi:MULTISPECIES: S-layer homology domain-containing protein [Bacillus]
MKEASNLIQMNLIQPSLELVVNGGGINIRSGAGIISGRGGGIFDPNAPITRASIMIDNALQYKGVTGELVALPFRDKHLITYKQPTDSYWCWKYNGTTTRGEAAAFLVKMLDASQK